MNTCAHVLTMQLGTPVTLGFYMQQHEKEPNIMCSGYSSQPLRHYGQA